MLKTCRTGLAALCCAGSALAADPYIAPNPAQAATPLLSQGRPDDAMRGLEARVGTNPFDAVSMNNLAAVKASRQDWYGAAELLVRAHRLAPDNGVIAGNLDQLNQYLDSRAAPSKASSTTPPEGAVWPEPPQLWDPATHQQAAKGAPPAQSSAPPVLRQLVRRVRHRRHRHHHRTAAIIVPQDAAAGLAPPSGVAPPTAVAPLAGGIQPEQATGGR